MTTHLETPDTPDPRADAPTPERTVMSEERSQIDILADYLMEHHADAITGGGAGDVAIRLIQALSAAIAERDAEVKRLEIDNSRLCEELNTIEIEVPDVE